MTSKSLLLHRTLRTIPASHKWYVPTLSLSHLLFNCIVNLISFFCYHAPLRPQSIFTPCQISLAVSDFSRMAGHPLPIGAFATRHRKCRCELTVSCSRGHGDDLSLLPRAANSRQVAMIVPLHAVVSAHAVGGSRKRTARLATGSLVLLQREVPMFKEASLALNRRNFRVSCF